MQKTKLTAVIITERIKDNLLCLNRVRTRKRYPDIQNFQTRTNYLGGDIYTTNRLELFF